MTADSETSVPADKPPLGGVYTDDPAPKSGIGVLFVVAILSGSFLLFLVQPMIARMALPRIGGAPAVWNSAMLVYQALLLGGYAYAHWLGRVPLRRQAAIHLGVLAVAALWLPIGLLAIRQPAGLDAVLWVPLFLAASIGPLFFAISAQAPLLQRWFAAASGGRDPYALYAASNIGSFGGLIAYPLIVEPTLALHNQSMVWSIGYALVFVLILICALRLPKTSASAPTEHHPTSPKPSTRRVLHWIALAIVPSGLMLATTTFLTTDIVAVPMLWVLPLGLYLLSFTIAFATQRTAANLIQKFAPVTILLFGGTLMAGAQSEAFLSALMALLLLFVVAIALHARMYDLRPDPDRLTGFYLAMSVGGALGGVFAAVIAPVIFDWTYEFPILIIAAGLLAAQPYLLPAFERFWEGNERRANIAGVAAVLVVGVLVVLGIANPGQILGARAESIAFLGMAVVGVLVIGQRPLYVFALVASLFLFGGYRALELSLMSDARTRSYFGVYTIREYADMRTLAHGTTLHGVQLKGAPELERTPTSYYLPGSAVGQVMQAAPALYPQGARVGVVGLGTGTLACYALPNQQWTFYEIDPAVVDIARNRFTFLQQCLPQGVDLALGDARITIAEQPAGSLDVLVLDAFSSDAVPMHLMTREAFDTYARALAPDGVLVVHISNRYLALEPVVEAAARLGGWSAALLTDYASENGITGGSTSDWVVMSKDGATLARLTATDLRWRTLRPYAGFTPWTDDFATIVPLLRALNKDLPAQD